MKAVLDIPLPPTLNDQVKAARTHWRVSADMKEEWTAKVAEAVNFQKVPQFPREVWLDFRWMVKNFARDPDNIAASAKFVMDGLAEAKVIQNDNLKVIQSPVLHWYEKGASDSLFLLISDSPIYHLDKFDLSQVADPTGAYDYDPESDLGTVPSAAPNATAVL